MVYSSSGPLFLIPFPCEGKGVWANTKKVHLKISFWSSVLLFQSLTRSLTTTTTTPTPPNRIAANLVCHVLLKCFVSIICIQQCLGSLVIVWDLVCCLSGSKR